MTDKRSDEQRHLVSLADALFDDLIAATDDDILNEVAEAGGDGTQISDRMRAQFKVTDMINQLKAVIDSVDVEVLTMKLSGNRQEYYVRLKCDGKAYEVRHYAEDYRNRAEYESALLRHVLMGEDKPNLMDPTYADEQWKVVGVDNHARESVADVLVQEDMLKSAAQQLADEKNAEFGDIGNGPGTFYVVKRFDYRLSRGMEDLV